jgi:undecaprenyl-diphosphatase
MISCFLQVIIFRKRPMTLDERLPIFMTISSLPILLASYYFHDRINDFQWSPLAVAGVFAAFGLPLAFADQVGRKIKGMFDWNWLDTALIGISQALAVVPGCDPLSGALLGAFLLNYRREPAAKYAYFISAPLLLSQMMTYLKEVNFHTSAPSSDLNWLSFGVALIVSFFVGLLAIGGFMKHVQQKGLGQYIAYRWLLATGVFITYWFKTYS